MAKASGLQIKPYTLREWSDQMTSTREQAGTSGGGCNGRKHA